MLAGRVFNNQMHSLLTKHCFQGDLSKESMIRRYRKHNEDVLKLVPKERLLVLNVCESQGGEWAHLINFLELRTSPPSCPFPRVNTTSEFQSKYTVPSNVVGWSGGLAGFGLPFYFMPEKKKVLISHGSSGKLLSVGAHSNENKSTEDESVLSYFNPTCW